MPAAIADKAELARRLRNGTPRQRRSAAKAMRAKWTSETASANSRAGWAKVESAVDRTARTQPARDAMAKKREERKARAKKS